MSVSLASQMGSTRVANEASRPQIIAMTTHLRVARQLGEQHACGCMIDGWEAEALQAGQACARPGQHVLQLTW